ncbi:MAG: hypothetical protein OHK0039_10520 [Bacteroidia bacterium]
MLNTVQLIIALSIALVTIAGVVFVIQDRREYQRNTQRGAMRKFMRAEQAARQRALEREHA